jgi:mannobiose 2-epimerase
VTAGKPRGVLDRIRAIWAEAEPGPRSREPSPLAPGEWRRFHELLERLLLENMVPFWLAYERERGEPAGRAGEAGSSGRFLVLEARLLWFFSRLARSRYGADEHLSAARRGFEVLRDELWDAKFGGFAWAVDPRMRKATKPDKHVYGQAFGIYALSEFAAASGSEEATSLARRLFGLLEARAHDAEYGGYREAFQRDWSPLAPTAVSYLHLPASLKLMNTHLHVLEAFDAYHRLTGDPLARQRLAELVLIQGSAVVRKDVGVCTNAHQRDWTPLRGRSHDRVSYGHDVENGRLLLEASQALGMPDAPLVDLARGFFSHALRFGFDDRDGGFFESGPFNRPADDRQKIWWIQAEGLLSALDLYRRTGDRLYLRCFERTLDWITTRQVDWSGGEWHAEITSSGAPQGAKVSAWKGPYHSGRAVLECLAVLDSLRP